MGQGMDQQIGPAEGKIGFGYMLQGGGTLSNVDPHPDKPSQEGKFLREPPHVMLFDYGNAMQGYPNSGENPDTSQPWVMWSDTPYEHLRIPIK
jgi:hypothetical protein